MQLKNSFIMRLMLVSLIYNIVKFAKDVFACSFLGDECYTNLSEITFLSAVMISLIFLLDAVKINILLILFSLVDKLHSRVSVYLLVGGLGACIVTYLFDSRTLVQMSKYEWVNTISIFLVGSLCGFIFATGKKEQA